MIHLLNRVIFSNYVHYQRLIQSLPGMIIPAYELDQFDLSHQALPLFWSGSVGLVRCQSPSVRGLGSAGSESASLLGTRGTLRLQHQAGQSQAATSVSFISYISKPSLDTCHGTCLWPKIYLRNWMVRQGTMRIQLLHGYPYFWVTLSIIYEIPQRNI